MHAGFSFNANLFQRERKSRQEWTATDLLSCYQHHAFQQHFSRVWNTFFYSQAITTNSPNNLLPPQANIQLILNIGIKFNLNN